MNVAHPAVLVLACALCGGSAWGQLQRAAVQKPEPPDAAAEHHEWRAHTQPKPLSEVVQRGLRWLVSSQLENGGWSQGEESRQMGARRLEAANVADTCISTLALMRSGSTPRSGPHRGAVRRAVDFVCTQIEEADVGSLKITNIEGTRVQSKIGPYIDTFLAALLLTEIQNQMPDTPGNLRVATALAKVINKIERNQKTDGTWDHRGWAAVMSQAVASKALNRAAQAGIAVDGAVLNRAAERAGGQYDEQSKSFKVDGDAADIELYATAGNIAAMQEAGATKAIDEAHIKTALTRATNQAERDELQRKLREASDYRAKAERAAGAVIGRLNDAQFVAGFGSNGGEEFLSYMLLGESLVQAGGDGWKQWDQSMTRNLSRIQNADGSWSGHHCITGRNFCTATALLVLTLDRASFPVAGGLKQS